MPDFDIPNPDGPFDLPPFGRRPFDRPFEFERPIFPKLRWGTAQIKILIVSDGSDYSEVGGFGLGIALKDAFDPAHPDHPSYANFLFTKAYHQVGTDFGDATPGFNNFTFTPGSLDEFDQVWLFGVSSAAPYLDAGEVAVVHAFMDNGGGVLAMGDHDALGLGLCGGIDRVRSMRKWWSTSPAPPPGMLQAPDSTDLTRNDTVHAITPGGDVNLGEQNDATPQRIYPNYSYRYRWGFWRPWRRVKYPHPVLCGPRGAITVMPDHQHEGDCILPDASFAGEYPGGVPVQIIARGRNVVGREKGGFVISDPREFGLIGVWDGHDPAANSGRVLVDSTWHHWFNVNLFGLRAENGNEYKDILAYFRNVAIWLSSPGQQAAMKRAGQLIFMLTPAMYEHTMTLREFRPEKLYQIGVFARDALGRIAPQCQSAAWYFDIISPFLPKAMLKSVQATKFEQRIDQFESAAIDVVATSIFGGIVNAIAVQINAHGLDKLEAVQDKMDDIAAEGAKIGLEFALDEMAKSQKLMKSMLG